MRKNRSKHEAKKPRLAKRALALCFALIFVCSCLLPAFAYGDVATFEADGGAALLDDGFAVDDSYGVDVQDVDAQDTTPSADTPATLPGAGGGINMGGSVVVDDSTTDNPYKANVTTDDDGNIVYTWDVDKIDLPEEATITRPDEDHALDKVDAAFSLPTNIYHFWLKEMSSYDLEEVSTDAQSAGMSVEEYLAMYGKDKGCYHIMTAADGADLNAYKFADPTYLDDTEGRDFAGWYTIDEFGEKHDFTFDQTLFISTGTTVEVFAKWDKTEKQESQQLSMNDMSVVATVGAMNGMKSVEISEPSRNNANELRTAIDEEMADKNYAVVMVDITPKDKAGNAVEPQNGEKVTVTLDGFALSGSDNAQVFHLTNSGKVEIHKASVTSNGGVEFETKSFSTFAVVAEKENTSAISMYAANAKASLNGNYEMYVGDTKTLSGSTEYRYGSNTYPCYYHDWAVSNNSDDKITLTANSSTATIQANSAGTVTITHYYGYSRSYYSTETTVVTIKENVTTGQWVYLYAQVEGDEEALKNLDAHKVANGQLWYTIGRVWVSNLRAPKWNQDELAYVTSGTLWNQVMTALGPTGGNVDRTTNINGKNASINIDPTLNPHVDWSQLGLKMSDGADDYMASHDRPGGSITWHLDGKIKVEQMRSYVIQYYDIATGNEIKNQYQDIATVNALIDINGDNVLAPNTIDYQGKTYHFVKGDPESLSITISKDKEKNIIKLYYEYTVEPTADTLTPDTPYINVEKRFTGITKEQVPDNFSVTIGNKTVTKADAVITEENGAIVLRWKVYGLDAGNYEVSESNTTIPGYQLDEDNVTGIGTSVEVKAKDITVTAGDRITSCSNKTFNVEVKDADGNNKFIVISTTDSNTNIILSADTLSVSQKAAVAKCLSNYKQGTFSSNTTNEFYSIKNETEFVIAGAHVTYDKAAGTVTIAATKQWNMVLSLSCKTDDGKNPEVTIVNPYTRKLSAVTITKNVTGEFGERNKDFSFAVTLTDTATGNPVTDVNHTGADNLSSFTLKHNQTVTLNEIPVGTTITIAETNADGYKTSATGFNTKTSEDAESRKFVYKVVENTSTHEAELVAVSSLPILGIEVDEKIANNAIIVTNEKKGDPDTGVLLDTLPYLIILGIAVAGGAALLLHKRKHDDE